MRTDRLALIALISVALASGGCKKKEDASSDESADKDKKASKKKGADDEDSEEGSKKKKKGDDESDDEGSKKKKGDDGEEGSKKKKSAGGAFKVDIESEKDIELKYGVARGSFGSSLHIVLSSNKVKCSSYGDDDDATRVEFDLPSGPSAKFFAGDAIGVQTYIKHKRTQLKQSSLMPQFTKAKVESFKLKEGETIKGSFEFDSTYIENKSGDEKKEYKYAGAGNFEVEICSDYGGFKHAKEGLPDAAPEGEAAGKFGGVAFTPKVVLARVSKYWGTKVEYITAIEFYEEDDTTCSTSFMNQKGRVLKLEYIGGASKSVSLAGSKQPAKAMMQIPKKGGTKGQFDYKSIGGFDARSWVKLDKLDFEAGAKLKGEFAAESYSDAKPEEKASFGGTFTAKVCNSGW